MNHIIILAVEVSFVLLGLWGLFILCFGKAFFQTFDQDSLEEWEAFGDVFEGKK